MFSKNCEGAIRAMIYIALESDAERNGKGVTLKEIAFEIEQSEQFTEGILNQLQSFLTFEEVISDRFSLTEDQISSIRMLDIVNAIDGDKVFNGCGLGLRECNAAKPCPMHEYFLEVRDDIKWMLTSTTLDNLTVNLKIGETFLKR